MPDQTTPANPLDEFESAWESDVDEVERREDERRYVIPKSGWRPIRGTGIPADEQMYPGGCPDPDWCRGNRRCYWECKGVPDVE